MNREILFRGKRIDNGEWVYGYAVKGCDKDNQMFIAQSIGLGFFTGGVSAKEVIPETVGQFTGLCDKNGNKIFEGDIVKYGNTIHKAIFEQRNGTAYFGLVYSEIETLPFGHYQDLKQIEVIGNIHNNPELLEV